MTGAVAADGPPRQRKNHPGRLNPIATHQNGTIVERGVSGEQVEQQLTAHLRTDHHAGVEEVFRPQVTADVDDDQGTTTLLRQPTGRLSQ